jgi:adenylate cyclase
MIENGLQRQLKAILSADVKGYSKLMGEDDESTVNTITAYREIISDFVEKHQGRVVDSPGDNILAEFGSTLNAVKSAIAIQQRLEKENEKLPADRHMQFRIGINLGDIIHKGDRIYGDGVNMAARIESLADPGGISVSRNVFDQIKKKVPQGFEYMGEHAVKNIAEPVRIYRVLLAPEYEGRVIGEPDLHPTKMSRPTAIAIAMIVLTSVAFFWMVYSPPPRSGSTSIDKIEIPKLEKASIAVMPFDNMSSDPEQEYFGDGISEDLITDLSKIPDLLVISRLSSFSYKNKSVKVQQIAEELGVRYVLEGSVRKADNLVRINAQLIDATNGHHLWAERYDGDMNDIFDLQDQITRKIAGSLAVTLTQDNQKHLPETETKNIQAYEAYLKGATIGNSLRNDLDKFAESLPWFEKAIELDPDYSRAYAALAETYIFGSAFGLQRKLKISPRLAYVRGKNYLELAMKKPTNIAYRTAGRVYSYQRQHIKAVEYGMKAIDLGPNEYRSNAFMATILTYAGRPDESFAFAERMRRADPTCLW